MAALYGHTEMTDLLIKKGAVVNASDYLGLTPLHIACQKGHQAATVSIPLHVRKATRWLQ